MKPLRIAYVTDERYPSPHTDCQQVIKTVDALGSLGCEVHLIQPRMAVHLFKSREQIKAAICDAFNVEGHFEVRDIRHIPASNLRIEKVPHALLGPLKARFGHYDVVHTRNLPALMVGAVMGLPMMYENYKAMPLTTPTAWKQARRALNRPNVLGLVTHSYYAAKIMAAKVDDPESIIGIPNGYDPKDFAAYPDKAEAQREIGLPDRPAVAAYTGHIRPDKGISTLLNLAEDSPDVHFLIVGGTETEVTTLAQDVTKRGLSNVMLKSRVDVAKVPTYLAAADVLLLPTAAAPLMGSGRSTVLPMKVFSYLAAGRPILAPDLPDTEGVLTDDVNCIKVPTDNRTAARDALSRLVNDRDLASRLAHAAAQDALRFTWKGRAEKLVEFIQKRKARNG